MKFKKTPGRIIFNGINAFILSALSLMCVYPILYVVFASLSDSNRFMSHKGLLLAPVGFSFAAYARAFQHPLIMSGYGNTLIVVIIGVMISLLLTAIGAFFLSRKNVLFQRPIAFAMIFTMYFSGGLIPFYFVVQNFGITLPTFSFMDGVLNIAFVKLGIFNSIWALILPTAISTYNLLVMRTGFMSIPDSLEESAKIDGAGHMTVLFKFMIPLAMPTMAVILLYYGVAYWNSWFNASIFLQDPNKYPLQLVLRQILLQNDTNATTIGIDMGDQMSITEIIKYAVIVIATLPILCVYPFLQRYFVEGIMIGAVKG